MPENLNQWIWQQPDWPKFSWDNQVVLPRLRQVRIQQGILLGRMGNIDKKTTNKTALDNLLQNIIASSAIEGEQLNVQSVRSSLAKRMGLQLKRPADCTDSSDGLAKMLFDAIENLDKPLSLPRLFQWHRWLFPKTASVFRPRHVGELRGSEPMQVVSGRIDKPRVHFEAPPRHILEKGLMDFIQWFNQSQTNVLLDPFLRAAISHFWFVTLHPFEDGNGRITRTLTDLALAQSEQQSIRLYAMSVSILEARHLYYEVLEQTQRHTMDITKWLVWFLDVLESSMHAAIHKIDLTLQKTRFWQYHALTELSLPQKKVLNRLLDGGKRGFEEGISASKYQKVAKVSKATATRHLTDLLLKNCIEKLPGGGRNTKYQVKHVK